MIAPVWKEKAFGTRQVMSAFAALGAEERRILSDWLDDAAPASVDAVLDLSDRPWAMRDAVSIIGVFEGGSKLATWIICRHADGWLLLRPAAATVRGPAMTLKMALAWIAAS